MLGKASESCDVYSFGILLLELASGRKPIVKVNSRAGQNNRDRPKPEKPVQRKPKRSVNDGLTGHMGSAEQLQVGLSGSVRSKFSNPSVSKTDRCTCHKLLLFCIFHHNKSLSL
jgi:serine/threonine protein kinase